MDLRSVFRTCEVVPTIAFSRVRQSIKPSNSSIKPLSPERDILPDGRQIYELNIHYSFKLDEAAEVFPVFPLLSNYLYENEYESQVSSFLLSVYI